MRTHAIFFILICLAAVLIVGYVWSGMRGESLPSTLEESGESRSLTLKQAETIRELESIGYLTGVNPVPTDKNVTIYKPERCYPGLNLYVPAHKPVARLVDMRGRLIHEWHHKRESVWPHVLEERGLRGLNYWRRVRLLDDGGLLAIYPNVGMIRLDKESNLEWSLSVKCHHDLDVDASGTIYVLTRKGMIIPRLHPDEPVLDDFITIVTPDGRVLRNVSILQSFEKSIYAHLLDRIHPTGDIFHTNTLEIFDGSMAHVSPLYSRGNALICMRKMDTIAIVDLEREIVIWAETDLWKKMHQPTLLSNGNMLIFDNRGHNATRERLGMSRVMEFNPLTMEVVWIYSGTQDNRLFSASCGSNIRLPNGNTLITESDKGRGIEVTPDGEIVWEYIVPHIAGEANFCVATLFEVIRLDETALTWLPEVNSNQPTSGV